MSILPYAKNTSPFLAKMTIRNEKGTAFFKAVPNIMDL
jgi:hypothetical protein